MKQSPKLPPMTRDQVNRAKSGVILQHYAAGTWPSAECAAQLAVIEEAWKAQQ